MATEPGLQGPQIFGAVLSVSLLVGGGIVRWRAEGWESTKGKRYASGYIILAVLAVAGVFGYDRALKHGVPHFADWQGVFTSGMVIVAVAVWVQLVVSLQRASTAKIETLQKRLDAAERPTAAPAGGVEAAPTAAADAAIPPFLFADDITLRMVNMPDGRPRYEATCRVVIVRRSADAPAILPRRLRLRTTLEDGKDYELAVLTTDDELQAPPWQALTVTYHGDIREGDYFKSGLDRTKALLGRTTLISVNAIANDGVATFHMGDQGVRRLVAIDGTTAAAPLAFAWAQNISLIASEDLRNVTASCWLVAYVPEGREVRWPPELGLSTGRGSVVATLRLTDERRPDENGTVGLLYRGAVSSRAALLEAVRLAMRIDFLKEPTRSAGCPIFAHVVGRWPITATDWLEKAKPLLLIGLTADTPHVVQVQRWPGGPPAEFLATDDVER